MNPRANSLYIPSHILRNTPVPRFTGKLRRHPPKLPDNRLSCSSGTGGEAQVTAELWRHPVGATAMDNSVYFQCIETVTCCGSLAQKWLGATKLPCSLQKKKGFGGLALPGSILSYLNRGWSYCRYREPVWENYLPARAQALSSSHFLTFPPGLTLCGNK